MKRTLFIIQFLCLIMTIVLPSHSSAIMYPMSTEDLTRESDAVIEGEVIDVRAYWSKDGKTIFTKATIKKSRVIKGRADQKKVIVEYEGGEVGDIGLRVSDVAPLKKGERVILFLRQGKSKKDGSAFNLVGKGQGKYAVGSDGIARKRGFSVISGEESIDNNIPVDILIDKIKRAK